MRGKNAEDYAVECSGSGVCIGDSGMQEMINTYDRPGKTFAAGAYAGADAFADGCEDKPGKRLPKAGLYAAAGVGYARAEWSVLGAEAKGPNASIGAGASVNSLSARAFAKAELASASASAGPLKATVGVAADTGVSVGLTGVEVKVLGTGVSIGKKISIAVLGNGIEFNLL